MLGRTANGMFWMFRYLERAENMARLLDAGLRIALTRDLETAESEWRSVISTSGQRAAYEATHDGYTGVQVWNFLLRDKENTASVREMLGLVRTNARAARNAISGEVWEAVNEGWMQIDAKLSRPVSPSQISEVVRKIRRVGTLVHGAVTNTMLRNEGYHFARAGTFIERGDSTARILDMKYYLLLPSLNYVGSSLDSGQWEQVLRSVSGDRAFSWLHAGQIDARGIVKFLVLDDLFPRSLAFCHSALRRHLAGLARLHGREGESNILMREADTLLADLTSEMIFDQGLHEFLTDFMARNAAIGRAIAEDYRFLS
ncbi:alpha-E domain-containing protein [Altererythrobacter sp. GH1-8]|uniref:alpha-E domain-containing protein n=1 Tax=Altererythrobacter sp. GH1-8 TaxID=3349333 RepID=UPI00374D3AF0